jgi:4-hydroxyphenylpyruvate dioxygenase-like putative hemolysin
MVVLRSVYINMYKLLRNHIPLSTYRKIVENHVLVDIQGEDVLFQIFTCMVLQREKGQEAPFLEFIQRVCSSKSDAQGKPAKIVPGCGGFGIRNFLTLFLSIELGKARDLRPVTRDP